MHNSFLSALGYLSIFIAPALLVVALSFDEPLLVVGTVLLLFPLARLLFGSFDDKSPDWSERCSRFLNVLPYCYAATITLIVISFLVVQARRDLGWGDMVAWAVALWLTFVFGTCVAHALLHNADRRVRALGHALSGVLGYPILGYEHNRHHRLAGNTNAAEWPRAGESLWGFAARRAPKVIGESLGLHGLALRGDHRSPVVHGLRIGISATAATWLLFVITLGWTGAFMYGAVVILVGFSIQLVTYMQHWGLGDDEIPDARRKQWGWEDDCRFQGWITMSLSIHLAHHRDSHRPYYLLRLERNSPRMPAGYVLLMFAAFMPPVWRRVMAPALEYWKSHPTDPPSAGRNITCAAVYRNVRPDSML